MARKKKNEDKNHQRAEAVAINWKDAIILLALMGLNWLILRENAFRRYEFWDMAAFMDTGYRVARGQDMYTDFYYFAGPMHAYFHALSYWIFGFNKSAVFFHLISVSYMGLATVYLIARKYLSRILASALGILMCFSFYGPVSFPWYDHNSLFWIFTALLAIEFGLVSARTRNSEVIGGICGFCVAMAFLTKANVGASGGLLILGTLTCFVQRSRLFIFFTIGFVVGMGLVLISLTSVSDFFTQTFGTFSVKNRLTNGRKLWNIISYHNDKYILGLALLTCWVGGREFVRRHVVNLVILGLLIFASVFNALSGSLMYQANFPLLGLSCVYLFALIMDLKPFAKNTPKAPLKLSLLAGGLVIFAMAAHLSWTHTDRLTAWAWRPSLMDNSYKMKNKAMEGWGANPRTGEGVDRVVDFLNKNVPQEAPLWIFPDVNMIYGITGREPRKYVPMSHQHGFPKGEKLKEMQMHFKNFPPEWVVYHIVRDVGVINDLRMAQEYGLTEMLKNEYSQVWSWGDFMILKRN